MYLTMKTNLQIATDFAQKIPKKHVLQVVLFGSVARGEDTKTSDIDIAIEMDGTKDYEAPAELLSSDVFT